MPAAEATARRFPWKWLVYVLLAYLLFLAATFPAARVTSYLQRYGVTVAGASGTIWKGRASFVQMRGFALGSTDWTLHPLSIFTGKLGASIESRRDDGYLNANVAVGFGGRVDVRNLSAALPLSVLSGLSLPGGGVNGWNGSLQIDLTTLELTKQWPTKLEGSINVANLVGPPRQPSPLGSFKITFGQQAAPGELRGSVTSAEDGPLDVVGSVLLSADRSYSVDAQVGTRPGAPASIVKAIEYLGLPDAAGRRPLSIAGNL